MIPPLYLLGVCDKYNEPPFPFPAKSSQGDIVPITTQDIIGLTQFCVSHIFPLPQNTFHLIFFVDTNQLFNSEGEIIQPNWKISIENETGKVDAFDIKIDGKIFSREGDGQACKLVNLKNISIFRNPGQHKFFLLVKNKKIRIGEIHFSYCPAPPLTSERIEAIKSDPSAYKWARFFIQCNKCGDKILPYVGFEKSETISDGIWYKDLPDEFICKCKNLKINLEYLKESLHFLLGCKNPEGRFSLTTERMYTKRALETIVKDFRVLIVKKGVKESELQSFIENNPIVLNCFSPQLIQPKARVGNFYETDFVIQNTKNELLLIEIEKPETSLFKNNGDQHHQLTHAFDQIENWLLEARKDRFGFIRNLKMNEVSIDKTTNIRGVLIAGRTKDKEFEFLEKIRLRGNIDFYTYDELLHCLVETIRSMDAL